MKKLNVLGIDGGGTKTEAVLMDENRQVLGSGKSGPSNYQSVGMEVATNSIQTAILQAVANSNNHQSISGICLGLAGVGRPEDFSVVENCLQEMYQQMITINAYQTLPTKNSYQKMSTKNCLPKNAY